MHVHFLKACQAIVAAISAGLYFLLGSLHRNAFGGSGSVGGLTSLPVVLNTNSANILASVCKVAAALGLLFSLEAAAYISLILTSIPVMSFSTLTTLSDCVA